MGDPHSQFPGTDKNMLAQFRAYSTDSFTSVSMANVPEADLPEFTSVLNSCLFICGLQLQSQHLTSHSSQ